MNAGSLFAAQSHFDLKCCLMNCSVFDVSLLAGRCSVGALLATLAEIEAIRRYISSSSSHSWNTAIMVHTHLGSQLWTVFWLGLRRLTTVVEHSRIPCTGPIVIQQGVFQNGSVARPLPLPALITASVLLPAGLRILCDSYRRGGRGPGIVKKGLWLHVNEVHGCNSGSDVAIRLEKEGDFEKTTGITESGPKTSTAPHL
jgi:hypothetical protein